MNHIVLSVLHLVFANIAPISGGTDPFFTDNERRAILFEFFNNYQEDAEVVQTDWADTVNDQRIFNLRKKKFIPVVNLGKLENGKSVYQKAYRPKASLPEEIAISGWYCRSAEPLQSFLATNIAREKVGMHLVSFQSFVDAKGLIRCQSVWVKLGLPEAD